MTLLSVKKYLDENAVEIDQRLARFATSAELFSSAKPRMIDKYENKWVAAYEGKVVASADSLSDVMKEIDAQGIQRADTMIRHIDRDEKTLIL